MTVVRSAVAPVAAAGFLGSATLGATARRGGGGGPVSAIAALAAAAVAAARPAAPLAARYATGVRATLLRSLPFDTLEFATFGALCRAATTYGRCRNEDSSDGGNFGRGPSGGRGLGAPQLAALGMLTGALVGAVTAPLDVLAASSLASAGVAGGGGGGAGAAAAAAGWRSVVATRGVGGLFGGARGFGGKVAWEAANSGIFFVVYEALMGLGEEDEGPPQS